MSRAEFLSVAEKRDAEAVVQFVKHAKGEKKEVKDTMSECSKRQLEDLWEHLYSMCSDVLTDDKEEPDQEDEEKKRTGYNGFLEVLASLATATIEQKTAIIPAGLLDTATLIHGLLLALPEDLDSVKHHWAQVFEAWWKKELDGWRGLVGNTLFYLIRRCLHKGMVGDVKTLHRWHPMLRLINLQEGGGVELKNLLGQCCATPCFVKSDEGRRFLAFAMSLNADLVDFMHKSIKNQIPYAPKAWLSLYAEVYFRAWQKASDEIVKKIEEDVIQNLMNHAIHASRDSSPNMASILFAVLHYFHNQRLTRGVDGMLLKLYNPILWRSLTVPNADVRLNAALLMLDAFPLQDSMYSVQDMDELMQKQFDFMQCLLVDPVPMIRAAAGEYICGIVRDYYELIPVAMIQKLLCTLLQDLAWDASSSIVRLAVVKGMGVILGNPMCHGLLKPLLPSLSLALHDNAEPVRIAIAELLLKVKATRSMKFWTICSVEHLLARLAVDSHPVVRRIVDLIFSSFMPLGKDPMEQISRCVALVESNPAAARVFFLNAPQHMSLSDTVKYMSMICRYVLECVRVMKQKQDSGEENGGASNPRNKRSKDDNNAEGSKDDNSDKEEEETESEGELTPEVLKGLLETIFLMWTAVGKQLNQEANSELHQSIMKKLSVTIPEVLKVTDDPKVVAVVVEIAGKLPPKTVPTISGSCLSKLRNMPDGSEESDYVYLLEALCMWKMSPNILQLCSDWLEDSLTPAQHTPAAAPGEPKKKGSKKCVQIMAPASQQRPQMALNYIQALLRSSVCKHILTDNHRPLLLTLNRLLSHVMAVLEQQLEGSVDRDTATLTSTAFSLHLRLSVLLHQQEAEDGPDCVNKMLAILKMGEEKLAPLLRQPAAVKRENQGEIDDGGDDNEEQKKGKGKKEGGKAVEEENGESLAEACVKVTLTVCSNMLMLGVGNQDLMTQLLFFCKCILNSNPDLLVIESVTGCLLQLTLFEQLDSDRHVTDVMSLVMLALNTHLHGNVEADSKVVSGLRNKLYEIVSAILERHHSKQASPTDISIVTDLTSTMMSAVLQELKYGSKHDSLPSVVDKKTAMPPLTGVVLASFSRNVLCRRSFVGELEKCVSSGAVTDVHTTHAVVHLLLIVQSKGTYCKGVDLGSVMEATRKLVTHISSQATDTMEEDVDVFRDVMSTVQDKLKRGTGQEPA